jgi:hypothetical protein
MEAAFHVTEAIVRFVTIVLLSGLSTDDHLYAAARPAWQGTTLPSQVMKRPTLGTWITLLAGVSKGLRQVRSNEDALLRSFALDDPRPIDLLASRDLGRLLQQALQHRNEWHGHSAAVGHAERRRQAEELEKLLWGFAKQCERAFERWVVAKVGMGRREDDGYLVDLELGRGSSPLFRHKQATLSQPPPSGGTYMWQEGAADLLELVPLVRVDSSADTSEHSCYFFDRIDPDGVRWVSFHNEAKPELREAVDLGLTTCLASLDVPAAGSDLLPTSPGDQVDATQKPLAPAPVNVPVAERRDRLAVGQPSRLMAGLDSMIGASYPDAERTVDQRGPCWYQEDELVAWVDDWGRGLRFVVDLPIEWAPYLPGDVLTDVPVSRTHRPAVELLLEGRPSFPAVRALVSSRALGQDHADQPDAVHGGPVLFWRSHRDRSRTLEPSGWRRLAAVLEPILLNADQIGRTSGTWTTVVSAGALLSVEVDRYGGICSLRLSDPIPRWELDRFVDEKDGTEAAIGFPLAWIRTSRDIVVVRRTEMIHVADEATWPTLAAEMAITLDRLRMLVPDASPPEGA